MKGTTRPAGILHAITLLINAFKKENLSGPAATGPKKAITKINAWLNKQRSVAGAQSNAAIRSLQGSLDWSRLRFEQLNQHEQFIIIPVKENFKTINNKDKAPINHLLLIADETGRIRKGNIVQYIPENNEATVIPPGTFFNLFNEKTLECSGQFTFLTITDRYLYEMNYQHGVIRSFKLMRPGAATISQQEQPGNKLPADNACLDWYLVTTVYHADGAIEILEDHLGQTHDGCTPNTPGMQGTLCNEFGGDGAGEAGYIYAGSKDANWFVGEAQNHLWYVRSKKIVNETTVAGSGKFTGTVRSPFSFFKNPDSTRVATWKQLNTAGKLTPVYPAEPADPGKETVSIVKDIDLNKRTYCLYMPAASS